MPKKKVSKAVVAKKAKTSVKKSVAPAEKQVAKTAQEIPVIAFCEKDQKFKFAREFAKYSNLNDARRYALFIENVDNDIVFRPCNSSGTIPVVYHYCSVQALENIIKDKSFRLTDPVHMNDSEEMQWGYKKLRLILSKIVTEQKNLPKTKDAQLGVFETSNHDDWPDDVKSLISALKNANPSSEEVEQFASLISEGMEKTANKIILDLSKGQELVGKIFIGCFSDNPDQLSQWRGYGDDGQGVSIGFNRKYLEKSGFCRPVLYYSNQQEDLIKRFVEKFIERYLCEQDIPPNEWCFSILPFIKPFGFHEEREYRLVYSPIVRNELSMGTYLSGKAIRQFCSLPVLHDSIIEIILGPKCCQEQCDLEAFFKEHDMPVPMMKPSRLSYR